MAVGKIVGGSTVEFADCEVLRTIHELDQQPLGPEFEGRPAYDLTFYVCRARNGGGYYLFYTRDRWERGNWEETEEEGSLCITPQLAKTIVGEEVEQRQPRRLADPMPMIEEALRSVETDLKDSIHQVDLRNDLSELNACLRSQAYRATLALAGRLLETCLKMELARLDRPVHSDWMVGKLLSEIEAAGEYCEPSLKNIFNIINQQRIVGVHAKEKVPIPSRHQAYMVTYAVLELLSRVAARGVVASA